MGFDCALELAANLTYHADVGNGLVEHEYDHLFVGRYNGDPQPDPAEVLEWRWVKIPKLLEELKLRPSSFTPWFEPALKRVLERESAGRS